MNNHNLVIYEFDELYKILVEIKKDINLSFEKANKQKLSDLNFKTNYFVFTKLIHGRELHAHEKCHHRA